MHTHLELELRPRALALDVQRRLLVAAPLTQRSAPMPILSYIYLSSLLLRGGDELAAQPFGRRVLLIHPQQILTSKLPEALL